MSAAEPYGTSAEALAKERLEETPRTDGPVGADGASPASPASAAWAAAWVGTADGAHRAGGGGRASPQRRHELLRTQRRVVWAATGAGWTCHRLAGGLHGSLRPISTATSQAVAGIRHHNPLGGGATSVDLGVSGQRNAEKVTFAVAVSTATLGIPLLNINLGPELDLQGRLATRPANTPIANTPIAGTPVAGLLSNGAATAVNMSGGNGAFPVTLEMRRGVVAQFTSACAALSTLGDQGDAGGKHE